MQLQDALDEYLLQLDADGRSIHTRKQYERHIRLLVDWLRTRGHRGEIEDIDHRVLAEFLTSTQARCRPDGQTKKATATNALRSSLRTFFAYLHAAGYTTSNSARLIRRARCAGPPPRALTEDEQTRLLKAAECAEGPAARRDEMLIRLMLATGIRVGSALGLDIEDLDLHAGEILLRSAKGGRDERVFLGRKIRDRLATFLAGRNSGPVFVGPQGERVSQRHAQRRFSQLLARAGIRRAASLHSLRHTFATDLYARVGDIFLVQRAMCHRSIGSTMVYAQVDITRLRGAVAI